LIAFWFWSNILIVNVSSYDFTTTTTVCEVIIIIVSAYLATIEIRELYISGFSNYFKNGTKIYDIISIILVLINVFRLLIATFNDTLEEIKQDHFFWRV